MLGGFHMVRALCTLYWQNLKILKINCLFDTLIESGTFGIKTVGEVANGTHYVRSFGDMLILSEVLLN